MERSEIFTALNEQRGVIVDAGSGEWAQNIARKECDRLLDILNEIKALDTLVEVSNA